MAVCSLIYLVVLVSLIANSESSDATTSESASYLVGENVTLNCAVVSGAPSERNLSIVNENDCNSYYWIMKDEDCTRVMSNCEEAKRSARADFTDNMYRLHIPNVQLTHTGWYECTTYNSNVTQDQHWRILHKVQLTVHEPRCHSTREVIYPGDRVSFKCTLATPGTLQWIASNGTELAARNFTTNDDVDEGSLVLNFTAKEGDDIKGFRCVAVSTRRSDYDRSCYAMAVYPAKVSVIELENKRRQCWFCCYMLSGNCCQANP